MGRKISRIYVRRYSDTGQVTAYIDYADGSRFESTLMNVDIGHGRRAITFGTITHTMFNRAKAAGLRLEREVW